MDIKKLNNGAAVEITDLDITELWGPEGDEIKQLILEHSVVVIRRQTTDPIFYTEFVNRISPNIAVLNLRFNPVTGEADESLPQKIMELDAIRNPYNWPDPKTYPVQRVTGQKVNGLHTGIFAEGTLDWHSNFNGHGHCDLVVLQGIKDCVGTSTTWLNTAMAFDQMPEDLKERCKGVYCEYKYAPEVWAAGTPEWQIKRQHDQVSGDIYKMWLLQENSAGRQGIYLFTNNKCKMITDDSTLYDDLCAYLFQEKFMYQHFYEVGDIVLSDQLLSLHKRDQDNPEILAKRVLHRLTSTLSSEGDPNWVTERNIIDG